MLRDVRLAVRSLFRDPGFTAVVVATLALGIGANTSIFSVVDAVLLEELPYPEPDRLVTVWQDVSRRGGPAREWLNMAAYRDVRDEPGLFESVGVWGTWFPTLTGVNEPVVLQGAEVSHEMFPGVLRVRPELGRAFLAEDDVQGAAGVVVLSHAAWQARFGGDPAVVGRSVSLSEQPYTVVGVMPEGFRAPFAPQAELWRALGPSPSLGCERGCYGVRGVARLAGGISSDQARARANALAARLEESYPESNTKVGLALFGLREDLTRGASRPLWVLLWAVGFVLLIACTNVANLLLARGAAREGDMAVRVALGAGKGALVAQVLAESLVLSLLGGAAGLALAAWGTDALLAMAPAGAVPGLDQVRLDGRVLGFTLGLTLATGAIFGLGPAWRAGGGDVQATLRAGGRGATAGLRLRSALVTTQVALALVLLVGAGLLVRSLQRLDSVELGFRTDGVLAMNVALPVARYPDGPARQSFYHTLLQRLAAVPGVASAGAINSLPLAGGDSDSGFLVEGEPPPEPGTAQAAWVRPVTDGYFETVELALVAGRSFTSADDSGAERVVIVNETLARRYFPSGDAVGRRLGFGSPDAPNWRTVVGVARDVRQFGIREPSRQAVYFPYRQVSMAGMSVVLRTEGDPTAMAAAAREAVSALDPALAASSIRPLQDLVDAALAPDRFVASLLSVFAAAALLLAAVGIYGVVSYGAARRMREMGIRVALGAGSDDVLRLVLRGALTTAGAGVALGLGGSLALGGVVSGLLFEVDPADPLTFAATAALLGAVAVLAAWVPARRAGTADPISALRQD